jgi:hypothetical protein
MVCIFYRLDSNVVSVGLNATTSVQRVFPNVEQSTRREVRTIWSMSLLPRAMLSLIQFPSLLVSLTLSYSKLRTHKQEKSWVIADVVKVFYSSLQILLPSKIPILVIMTTSPPTWRKTEPTRATCTKEELSSKGGNRDGLSSTQLNINFATMTLWKIHIPRDSLVSWYVSLNVGYFA